jgi:CelD/BcsL family acetyltransferase involved in cellulose biosynthesis
MSQNVKVIKPEALSAEDRAHWIRLQASNPALYSPYFHVEYTEMVGQLRSDVQILRVSQNDQVIAFLPFQGPKPGKAGFARPVGAPMTDYQGFICAPDASFDQIAALKDAGIGAFHYSAWISSSGSLMSRHQNTEDATVMDLKAGAETWRSDRDSSYRRHLKSHRRRVRKAEQEIGPRRFEFASKDTAIFDQLIAWKRGKFQETGKFDVLSAGWTLELITQLWQSNQDLRCQMHALYFGDRLAAVDLGLTNGDVFHSWIVSYDSELHTYAPGIQLLEGLIDEASRLGYSRIDLGVETGGYKRHYATHPVEIGSGFVAVKGPAAALSSLYGQAENFGRKALKDAPGKLRRRYSQIAACDDSFSGRAKAMLQAVSGAQSR